MIARRVAAALVVAALAGCATTPEPMDRPAMPLPSGFAFAPLHAERDAPRLTHDAWWLHLDDPLLTRLIEEGLGQNLDIRIAMTRIEQARARAGATGQAALTTGTAELGTRASWRDGARAETEAYAQFEPRFIVDLFGGEASRAAFAQAELRAASFDSAAVRLAFQLDLATAYLDLRHFDAARAITRQSVSNRAQLRDVVRARLEDGAASELDLRRAEAGLADSQAGLADIEIARAEAALRLSSLLAISPASMMRMIDRDGAGQPRPRAKIDMALPARLLRNRPDILAAEARLAAAMADLGVTEAELKPSLQITGEIRFGATNLANFGPFLRIPVLDRPRRQAAVALSRANIEEAELLWRQAVQEAIREVELGLVRYRQTAQKQRATDRAVTAYRESFDVARNAFEEGQIALPELLDLEQDLNESRLQQAAATRDFAIAWAQLHVAVGHGWHGVYRVERCCKDGDPYPVAEKP